MTHNHSATFRDGTFVPDESVPIPEGLKAYYSLPTDLRPEELGWDDPEQNRQRAERLAALEPLETTPEEEAEWQAFYQKVKEYTLNAMRKEMGLDE